MDGIRGWHTYVVGVYDTDTARMISGQDSCFIDLSFDGDHKITRLRYQEMGYKAGRARIDQRNVNIPNSIFVG